MKITLFSQKYKNTHRRRLKKQPISTKVSKNLEIFKQAKTKSLMTVINPLQKKCFLLKKKNKKIWFLPSTIYISLNKHKIKHYDDNTTHK